MSCESMIGPVLVTGGSGFLGGALIASLLAAGEKVIAVDLKIPNVPDPRVTYITGDILDIESISDLSAKHHIRAIVHLAALVIPACKADPVLGAKVNVIGHINLLEVARRHEMRRFLYTSSIAAKPRPPMDSPVNLYGTYKRACEDISKIWFLEHGSASVGLRPNVVYGPGREAGETAAITFAIKAAARGEPYQMPFAGTMCFHYVDDVVDIMIRCLREQPQTAVVSDLTTVPETMDDVIAAIRACAPDAQITSANTQRPAPPKLNNKPLVDLIGNRPTVSLFDGVQRTFDYYTRQATSNLMS